MRGTTRKPARPKPEVRLPVLDKLISPAAEVAFTALRRSGFVGGLTREVAGEVIEVALSDDFDWDIPHYIAQWAFDVGADDDARYCVSAQWPFMANAPK